MNDAVANITAIAQARGRPVDWAVSTVSDAKSYSAAEAVAAGAVDGIAATRGGRAGGRERADASAWPAARRSRSALAGAVHARWPDEPVPGLPAPPGRPEPRLHPVRCSASCCLVFELANPNFVTGHLGRAGPRPGVHRVRQPAAQRGRAAADRLRRSSCSLLETQSPATGCSRSWPAACVALGRGDPVHASPAPRRCPASGSPGR